MGCDVKEARPESGVRCQSILIFDRFAAGYASSADRFLDTLFHSARSRLECPAACDSACPRCVLGFDQRFAADSLDRREALAVLTDSWVKSLQLPEEFAFFGAKSRPEYRRLSEAIWHAVMRRRASGVRLYAGGAPESWDIAPSPLRELAYRLAGQAIAVEIVIPGAVIDTIAETDRYMLASLADHPKIAIRAISGPTPRCGGGWLLAETLHTPASRWAFPTESALTFGLSWGDCEGLLTTEENGLPSNQQGLLLQAETLRPRSAHLGDCEIEIHHDIDGPIQGFGKRLWLHVSEHHALTQTLLTDKNTQITATVTCLRPYPWHC